MTASSGFISPMLLVCFFTLQAAVCVLAKPRQVPIPTQCSDIMSLVNNTNTLSLTIFTLASVVIIVSSVCTLQWIRQNKKSGWTIGRVIMLAALLMLCTSILWWYAIPRGVAHFSGAIQIDHSRTKNGQEICNTNTVIASQAQGLCPTETRFISLCTFDVIVGLWAIMVFNVVAQFIVLVLGHNSLDGILK